MIQRSNQIEPFDATATCFSNTVCLHPNHDRRPMIFAGNSRSDNSQDARMPAACAYDDRRVAHRVVITTDLLLRRKEDLLFHTLALAVLFIEKFCQCSRFILIFRKKKL